MFAKSRRRAHDRRMAAVLTAIATAPGGGFDVAKRARLGVGRTYVCMARAEESGWLRITHGTLPSGRPDRLTYYITESGAAELARLTALPGPPTVWQRLRSWAAQG